MKKKYSTRFLFIVSFVISISILGAILFFTVGPKTWEALQQIHLRYIFLSFILGLLFNSFDSVRIKILCRAFGYHLPFWEGLKTVFAYNFLANVTPSAMGGEPILIYKLIEKTGMDTEKATTIAIVRGILLILIISICGPAILFFHREYLKTSLLKHLFDYVSILFLIIIGIIIYGFFNLNKLHSLLERIIGFFQKYRLFRKHTNPQDWARHVFNWLEKFIASFKYLFQHQKVSIIYTAFFTILTLFANYSIAYVLIKGLGYDIDFLEVLSIQIILYFLLYLTPTPGGSGFAEGGFYLLFYNLIPQHLIGILLVLWRFFIAYLWVIAGWFVIIKGFGFKGLEEIKEKIHVS
ncbi:MAG: lysylphosphatidylglycerol synthase transmembrane domain-containing protein [bacterium]